jgi:hypothetical protein
MKEKSEENEKEMKRIYSDIEKDWNLTGYTVKDFINVIIREFYQENNITQKIDNQILVEFAIKLLNKIYAGMTYHCGKSGTENLDNILHRWVIAIIDEEMDKRFKESNNGKIIDDDSTINKNVVNASGGGLIYIQ